MNVAEIIALLRDNGIKNAELETYKGDRISVWPTGNAVVMSGYTVGAVKGRAKLL